MQTCTRVSRRAGHGLESPTWHVADLTDLRTCVELVEGVAPDVVFHLASAVTGARDVDLLFAPNRFDVHQDHRGLVNLAPTGFRDHLVLGYEIVKWDGDLGRPSVYQPLDATLLETKIDLLWEHYPSQRHRPRLGPRSRVCPPRTRAPPIHRVIRAQMRPAGAS